MKYQSEFNPTKAPFINFPKMNGLVPAIIQDNTNNKILMLGYMNKEAYERTICEGYVYFFSRSKERLWLKGETSKNYLEVSEIKADCDNDAILIKVSPRGNTCHKGTYSCFREEQSNEDFLNQLEQLIRQRKRTLPENSYTTYLFTKGINKIAQKVGEEAVELVIEAKDDNTSLFLNEAADLLYHFLVLINSKDLQLKQVVEILEHRHNK